MIIDPKNVPIRQGSNYPDLFKPRVSGRLKQRLGDAVGLTNFGVNQVTLQPGGQSALRHWHTKQDEFIYVLSGELTLITDVGEQILTAGMAAGFPAGEANGHHLVNRSEQVAVYLEVGDRTPDDQGVYPDDDLVAKHGDQGWVFTRKDGSVFED
ncbi:cupin domain-containing protein [Leptolyngbya sp. FACHB-541]|uniref:cupin domain-containing protein n=1 Tax=Leptolyngbya sp. FACHB-541 TaxID=2692810 RepID=UPI001689D93A|nr:cupin domain-containing protein [Leptolyngbya sp. FACHB-541]MBD1998097.1 cupin domain-containing protein [Leptolyngbya sp. FACHB-541]